MNTQSSAMSDSLGSQAAAPAITPMSRVLYWSIRRELWEIRSVYLAPLAVAGLSLFGYMIAMIHLPAKMRLVAALGPMQQEELIEQPYNFVALLLMGTYLLVAAFYCLDALYGERRDRSILFWKSLPVSDLMVVLSKASIPVLILPLLIFALTVATQFIMLMMSTVVLLVSGADAGMLWTRLPMFRMSVMLLFHLLCMHGLYWAPFYGWMLLVSAWARRAPFLWATLPPIVVGVVERIAFGTSYFADILASRLSGGPNKIDYPAQSSVMQDMTMLDLGRFLASPGLWIGLTVFAAFMVAAVRLRHNRGPI